MLVKVVSLVQQGDTCIPWDGMSHLAQLKPFGWLDVGAALAPALLPVLLVLVADPDSTPHMRGGQPLGELGKVSEADA